MSVHCVPRPRRPHGRSLAGARSLAVRRRPRDFCTGGRPVGHGRHADRHRAVLDPLRARARRRLRRTVDRRGRHVDHRLRPDGRCRGAAHPWRRAAAPARHRRQAVRRCRGDGTRADSVATRGARAARRPQAARGPLRARDDVVEASRRRSRQAAAAALVPSRDHRRHGDERQAPSRAVSPRRRGARCRSAGVCGDRGLADRPRLGRSGRMCGGGRAQPRPDPGGAAPRGVVDVAGCHPGTARRVRRAHPATPGSTVTERAGGAAAAAPTRRSPARRTPRTARRPRGRPSPPRRRGLVVRHPRHQADLRPGGIQRPRLGSRLGTRRINAPTPRPSQRLPPGFAVLVRGAWGIDHRSERTRRHRRGA